jgi:hypothetical protein
MISFNIRKSDDISSIEYLNRSYAFNLKIDQYDKTPKSKIGQKRESINTSSVDRLKCLNMLTKLESYSNVLDEHLNLFSQLEEPKIEES